MSLLEKLKDLIAGEVENPVALAADTEVEIDVATVGTFRDMAKNVVTITKEILHELAASLDLEKYRPKIKRGHTKPRPTDEAALGEVIGLRVDGDKLLAKLAMGKDIVEDVRNRKYTERSIEYDDTPGKRKFLGLALLGARDPAIAGLSPFMLQAGEIEPGHVIMLSNAEPVVEEKETPIDDGGRINSEQRTERSPEMTDVDKAALETAERKAKENAAKVRKFAEADVDSFLGSDAAVKRGLPLIKAIPVVLRALAGMVADADEPTTVKLAGPDGKELETDIYQAMKSALLCLPEKLDPKETTRLAGEEQAQENGGADREKDLPASLQPRDPESDKVYLAAMDFIADEKKNGREVSLRDAVVKVTASN